MESDFVAADFIFILSNFKNDFIVSGFFLIMWTISSAKFLTGKQNMSVLNKQTNKCIATYIPEIKEYGAVAFLLTQDFF